MNSFVRFLGEFEDTKKSFWNYLTFFAKNITHSEQRDCLIEFTAYIKSKMTAFDLLKDWKIFQSRRLRRNVFGANQFEVA